MIIATHARLSKGTCYYCAICRADNKCTLKLYMHGYHTHIIQSMWHTFCMYVTLNLSPACTVCTLLYTHPTIGIVKPEITLVQEVGMSVCVCPPPGYKNLSHEMKPE